jgi:hypothetical protein
MLLDQIFGKTLPKEIVIVRKDGVLKHEARDIQPAIDHDSSQKPLFPISKERK